MINGVDYEYYWNNEKEYKRITSDQMDNEGALSLCEAILMEIAESNKRMILTLKQEPNKRELKRMVRERLDLLRSIYIDAITMGHGDEIANNFEAEIAKLGIDISKKEDNKIENQVQLHLRRLEKSKKPLQNDNEQVLYGSGANHGIQKKDSDFGAYTNPFTRN